MKNLLNFFIEIGKLKGKKRRGWLAHQIKNPESTAEHTFRMAILAWILGKKKKLNLEKVIKTALIHDLCEVYAPDLTPYDAFSLKNKKKITIDEILKKRPQPGRPTTLQRKKLEKIKQRLEMKAIKKLLSNLSPELKKEIKTLWLDYEKRLTPEGRFVKQVDRLENLLQGLEYWKKYGKIQHHLWIRRIKEVVDDQVLLNFIKEIEKKFF